MRATATHRLVCPFIMVLGPPPSPITLLGVVDTPGGPCEHCVMDRHARGYRYCWFAPRRGALSPRA